MYTVCQDVLSLHWKASPSVRELMAENAASWAEVRLSWRELPEGGSGTAALKPFLADLVASM